MIDINEIGATAFVIASIRSLEPEQPHQLFNDPYAQWFSNERALAAARQLDEAFPPSTTMVRFRTRYFNRFIGRGIADGARQVILLGGGFDMRSHLFDNADVSFFEVDQKAVLLFKSAILERHGIQQSPSLLANYLQADVPSGLADHGFDPDAPTLIVWEGNTMYLPPDSIMPFLNRLADAIPSFRIAFDYFAVDLQNREVRDGRRPRADRRRGACDGGFVPNRVPGLGRIRTADAAPDRRVRFVRGTGRRIRIGRHGGRISRGLARDTQALPVLCPGKGVAGRRRTTPKLADGTAFRGSVPLISTESICMSMVCLRRASTGAASFSGTLPGRRRK